MLALRPAFLTALLFLSAPGSAAADDAADVRALVDQVREAYGGDAIAEWTGFRARGKVLSLSNGLTGRLRLAVALDGSMRIEIHYPNQSEVRILAGRLTWSGGRVQQPFAGAEMAESIRLQFHRLAAPFELLAAAPESLALTGTSDEGWVRIEHAWSERIRTTYEVDPETGRIRRVEGVIGSGGDDEMVFVSESHDFREVDGVLFPFRTTTIVGEVIAAEIVLDRLTAEDDFGPEEFRPRGRSGGDI